MTTAEAARRLARFGPNRLEVRERRSLVAAFVRQFTHLMAFLLWLGGTLAWLSGARPLAWAVWAVNVVNGAFGFAMEYSASRAAEALAAVLPPRALVIRDGAERLIPAEEVVQGDLLVLVEGDRVSADALVLEADEPRVDESALTGESLPVSKRAASGEENPSGETLLLAGTTLVAGGCRAVVTATGRAARFGRIAEAARLAKKETSPLERQLSEVARLVALAAGLSGAVFLGLAWALAGLALEEGAILALGLVVAFTPEGLLPVTTLSLAAAARRMAGRNALVKRLSTVEALGAAEVICTDKTGTLTLNELTVTDVWIDGRTLEVSGAGFDVSGRLIGLEEVGPVEAERRFFLAAALCNDLRVALAPLGEMKKKRRGRRKTLIGDPVDIGLRVLAEKAGVSPEAESAARPRLYEHPFDSEVKRMSVAVADASGRPLLLVKGAPAETLERCERVWRGDEARPLTDEERAEVLRRVDGWAAEGLRVILLACRTLPTDWAADGEAGDRQADESGLELLGLAALFDPPRPGVAKAMAACRAAGVRVVMITGDHPLTARTLAARLGVTGQTPVVVTGEEVERWNSDELRAALAAPEIVFARMAPEQKLAVVEAFQALGKVVAVTGDGVNDAPALKKADIGISMGLHGVDAAKEASDMILLDDNFATIVAAIEEGRAVWDNIRRFIGYIFSSNVAEAVPFVLFALSRGRIPLALGVMHVLLIDLGADLAPALGLGMEPPKPGVMRRPPRGAGERIVDRALMVRAFGVLGPLMGAACMAGFYLRFWTNGRAGQWLDLPGEGGLYASATAAAYGAVVFCQIGGALAWRDPGKPQVRARVNWTLWTGLALAAAFPALVAYVPWVQAAAGTGPVGWPDWTFMAGCAVVVWGVGRAARRV